MDELFKVGDVLRLKEPERFIERRKLENRDAVLIKHMLDYGYGSDGARRFRGRVRVEFQKRNGRGKVFQQIMKERDFILATPASPTKEADHG